VVLNGCYLIKNNDITVYICEPNQSAHGLLFVAAYLSVSCKLKAWEAQCDLTDQIHRLYQAPLNILHWNLLNIQLKAEIHQPDWTNSKIWLKVRCIFSLLLNHCGWCKSETNNLKTLNISFGNFKKTPQFCTLDILTST